MLTEKRKISTARASKKYHSTPKGKTAIIKAHNRYIKTDKGREAQKKAQIKFKNKWYIPHPRVLLTPEEKRQRRNEYARKCYKPHPLPKLSHEEKLKRRREYGIKCWRKTKLAVYGILGGMKCVKCGFSDERALQLDHINNDGYLQKTRGKDLYRYCLKNPDWTKQNLQVLCANCNWIKRV